jgi:hypothetical protein
MKVVLLKIYLMAKELIPILMEIYILGILNVVLEKELESIDMLKVIFIMVNIRTT